MTIEREDTRLTAYALGELSEADKRLFEAELDGDAGAVRELEAIEETLEALQKELRRASAPKLEAERRKVIEERRRETAAVSTDGRRSRRTTFGVVTLLAAAGLTMVVGRASEPMLTSQSSESTNLVPRGTPVTAPLERPATTPVEQLEPAPTTSAAPTAAGKLEQLAALEGELLSAESDEKTSLENDFVSGEGDRFAGGITTGAQVSQKRLLRAEVRAARERYDHVTDNRFVRVASDPRSTFSIDVDTASYALVRRHLLDQRVLPPPGAVRIEELVNYFDYAYPEPSGGRPFSVVTDVASAPWAPSHRLLRIGIKGKHLARPEIPGANLVFLIDVSGSMADENKLPLLKRGLALLAERLRERDRVAMVVYAGSSGLVLPATRGSERRTILGALERLGAGGSTNGSGGIELAYQVAREGFVKGGVNRVILATDGDFNVGITNESELVALVERQAKSGVFLSVLGFGGGNYNDSMLEKLADKGNGNYAYIDDLAEARKVLVEQASGTLVTIAKDVKIQIEFNPSEVESFRLLGYENRVLAHRDFNDDRKDAGDIGADHRVTALYEIVPAGSGSGSAGVDPLKYQAPTPRAPAGSPGELATVKLRFKTPEGSTSELIEVVARDDQAGFARATADFRFAAAVAEFGMLLRNSPHKGGASYEQVLDLAEGAATDERRREFLRIARAAQSLATPR